MFNWNQTYMACVLAISLLLVQMCCVVRILLNVQIERPVYCLMVTGYKEERLSLARKSIENFKDQTYGSKHLIILNQSKERLVNNKKNPSFLEVFVDNENKTLGELRNMSLQFVPPNAIWTTWDDDDWRDPNYISQMVSIMMNKKVEFLMFQNRIEYNENNKFSFIMTMKSGFMTFFSIHNPFIEYDHVSTLEDVNVKKYALKHMKTYIYNNDPKLYIRLIHNDNTSIYVKNKKNSIQDTKNNTVYFENELNKIEKKYVDNIISKYYK
jgi:hypothetical protein